MMIKTVNQVYWGVEKGEKIKVYDIIERLI